MSDERKRTRTRIAMLDIAKAITIFLVIVGHTTSNTDTIMYRRFLYAFHMPLFFFLAGLSTKPRVVTGWQGWKSFLYKNSLALVAPYLIWGLVYAPFSFANMTNLFYGSWQALGKMGTLTSLWYLACFFIARIFVQGIVTLLGTRGFEGNSMRTALGVCAVPSFAIGLLLPHLEQGYPWCFDVAFVAMGFILLGMALRHALFILTVQRGWVLFATFLGSLAVLCVGTIVRGDALDLVLMCGSQYGNILWFFINSFAGTMVVISASMLLIRLATEGSRPFSLKAVYFIGMNTMGIFLLHKPMLQELFMPFFSSWVPGPQLIAAILASALCLAASMGLCVVIEKYIPQLLGQFPSLTPPSLSKAKKAA